MHKLTNHLKSNGGALSLRNLGNSHGFDRAEIHQLMASYPDRYEIAKKTNGERPSDILIIKRKSDLRKLQKPLPTLLKVLKVNFWDSF